MKIKDLKNDHPRIYELAMLRQKEAGNEANDDVLLHCARTAFPWSNCFGEYSIWARVDLGFFDTFYEIYPQASDQPISQLTPEEIRNNWNEKFATNVGNVAAIQTPAYYDNSKGSLYQIGLEQGWNSYQQDLIKRISRCENKGEFFSDLNKTKALIDLYIKEQGHKFEGNK